MDQHTDVIAKAVKVVWVSWARSWKSSLVALVCKWRARALEQVESTSHYRERQNNLKKPLSSASALPAKDGKILNSLLLKKSLSAILQKRKSPSRLYLTTKIYGREATSEKILSHLSRRNLPQASPWSRKLKYYGAIGISVMVTKKPSRNTSMKSLTWSRLKAPVSLRKTWPIGLNYEHPNYIPRHGFNLKQLSSLGEPVGSQNGQLSAEHSRQNLCYSSKQRRSQCLTTSPRLFLPQLQKGCHSPRLFCERQRPLVLSSSVAANLYHSVIGDTKRRLSFPSIIASLKNQKLRSLVKES